MSRFLLRILPAFLLVQLPVNGLARDVNRSSNTQIQVGDAAPSKIGGTLSSGDWIGIEKSDFKGKVVLLVYWSFADANRQAWESKLKEIRDDQINNDEFRILSICMDDGFEKWRKYLNDAPPLERNGKNVEFYGDRLWWQANIIDWEPPASVVEKTHLPVAHLVDSYGRFAAVRIPLEDLQRTVAANVQTPYSHAPLKKEAQSADGSQGRDGKSTVWTDPAKAAAENRSFSIQGEYVGVGKNGQWYGIQLRAADRWRRGTNSWYLEQGLSGALYEASGNSQKDGGLPGFDKAGTRIVCGMGGTWHDDGAWISLDEGGYEAKIHRTTSELYDATYEQGKRPVAVLSRTERKSPTLGAKPADGAIVLFDGTSADAWVNGRVESGLLYGNEMRTKQAFRDYQLHLEFRTPLIVPRKDNASLQRSLAPPPVLANIFHQGRYATLICDSFCDAYYFERPGSSLVDACCAIDGVAPHVNACLSSLVWQTYDAEFRAARFDGTGQLTQPARITARLNGIVVQTDQELPTKSANAPIADDGDGDRANASPLYVLQNDYPVYYRNIWIVRK